MHVIGTAGHVDHGKSALVQAITNINPDRLKEEQQREMTIVLGFAWFTLPSGQKASIVDVPGHEDFIKNMLAGVGGIDLALLVVAADESVMPQTREHLAILDLLQVKGGVVALSKIDLVEDDEWLDLVKAEVAELLDGTCLAGAPLVPVSARTGQGIPQLMRVLDEALAQTKSPENVGRPRLPIDRVFTISGFGTIVTGTLTGGELHTGDEVEIQPPGLTSRIRGLQTHKESVQTAVPGSRVAVNLGGVAVEQLARGDVLTLSGILQPSYLLDVQLRMLVDMPRPLKHNVMVDLFSGAAEIPARVRLLGTREMPPGKEGWAQLQLARPAAVLRGDRFILRQPSPGRTIGGGSVLHPHPRRKWRRFRPEVARRLETLSRGTPAEILLAGLQEREPITVKQVLADSPLRPDRAQAALDELLGDGRALMLGEGGSKSTRNLVSEAGLERIRAQMLEQLQRYHRQYPLRPGMPREELKSRLKLQAKPYNDLLTYLSKEGTIGAGESAVWAASHTVQLRPAQEEKVHELMARFQAAPHTPPSYSECEEALGTELLGVLLRDGQLVRVAEGVLFSVETYQKMVDWIVRQIRADGQVTAAQVRDHFGTSRKYVIALLEHLDDRKVTRRVGDARVLR